MSSTLQAPPGLVKPSYIIYWYRDRIFKIVHFKGNRVVDVLPFKGEAPQKYDHKLPPSISRAKRVVLELALCNTWKYFCAFTLDKTKYNRYDLPKFHKDFLQWIRDQRKKYKKDNIKFEYVLVPELHKDGAWHMHGLFSDISFLLTSFRELAKDGRPLPKKLLDGDYYNWPAYQKKFGFCSFGVLRDPVAASFYTVKYMTKTVCETNMAVGKHLYIPSRGLNKACFHGEIYGESAYFNSFIQNRYEFVETGFTSLRDGCDWSFGMEFMEFDSLEPFGYETLSEEKLQEYERYFEGVQTVLKGF